MSETTLNGDQVFDRLVAEFEGDELRPGARLRESLIAKKYGVSRTPVREALKRLEAIGLLVHAPHRGMVVAAPGPERCSEIVSMRETLACAIMRGAVERDGAEAARRTEAILDAALAEPLSNRSLRSTWRDIEIELERMAGSALLSDTIGQVRLLHVLSRRPCANLQSIWSEAEDIIRALISALATKDVHATDTAVRAFFAWNNLLHSSPQNA